MTQTSSVVGQRRSLAAGGRRSRPGESSGGSTPAWWIPAAGSPPLLYCFRLSEIPAARAPTRRGREPFREGSSLSLAITGNGGVRREISRVLRLFNADPRILRRWGLRRFSQRNVLSLTALADLPNVSRALGHRPGGRARRRLVRGPHGPRSAGPRGCGTHAAAAGPDLSVPDWLADEAFFVPARFRGTKTTLLGRSTGAHARMFAEGP
jgi:hypothetical protein